MRQTDLLAIGAGPAGMAAATTAAQHGVQTTVLDEQPAPGGQIWRGVLQAGEARKQILGQDYGEGEALARATVSSTIDMITSAVVWRVDAQRIVSYSRDGQSEQIQAARLIICSGTRERPTPIPGWTLPGVTTAGAAQILLKSAGLVPVQAVLAGSGPLLYLIANQLIAAGQPPVALVETQTKRDLLNAARHLPAALRNRHALSKGAALIRGIRKAGVRRYTAATRLAVYGSTRALGLRFAAGGRNHEVASEHILLHCGVVPDNQITQSLGLKHIWHDRQLCFVPAVDEWGATPLEGISVAGDGAGIGGAVAARERGTLSALDALVGLGKLSTTDRTRLATPVLRTLQAELSVRALLETAYPPAAQVRAPHDDTLVCRCEEVTAGDIRGFAKLGCTGPNQTKAFGRCGMGPCQGRFCGLTVTEILARELGHTQQEVGSYRIRAPLRPITVGELASLAPDDTG